MIWVKPVVQPTGCLSWRFLSEDDGDQCSPDRNRNGGQHQESYSPGKSTTLTQQHVRGWWNYFAHFGSLPANTLSTRNNALE